MSARYMPNMRTLTPEERARYNPKTCPEIVASEKANLLRRIGALVTCIEAGHAVAADSILTNLPAAFGRWNAARYGFPHKPEEPESLAVGAAYESIETDLWMAENYFARNATGLGIACLKSATEEFVRQRDILTCADADAADALGKRIATAGAKGAPQTPEEGP